MPCRGVLRITGKLNSINGTVTGVALVILWLFFSMQVAFCIGLCTLMLTENKESWIFLNYRMTVYDISLEFNPNST